MKRVAHYYGIDTPRAVFAYTEADVDRAAKTLRFPLIVKHPNSYSSIGLTPESRVHTTDALKKQWQLMSAQFGSALIEEFIEGREFTVLVAENPSDPANPIAYEPVEFRFPEGETFKHFDMKWKNYHEMWGELFEDRDDLRERLKRMSKDIFVGLRGVGYGRCDIRMDDHGKLYMLEINPNCGVFYSADDPGSADFILQFDPAGHEGFVETILAAAFNRIPRARKWTLGYDGERAYGMHAAEDIEVGGVIEQYEEQPHVLVTKTHVEAHWDRQRRDWFRQYAYPITDEIFVIWSDDPDLWKPINHSCDPNAWLTGLNLTARRPIAAGEEITLDYATFCNESTAPFECTCGSPHCRGTITGADYLQSFVDEYGAHVSDYVRSKRAVEVSRE
jgi:D-alanine-D-alanine ligase